MTVQLLVAKFFEEVNNIEIDVECLDETLRGSYIFEDVHRTDIFAEEVQLDLAEVVIKLTKAQRKNDLVVEKCEVKLKEEFNFKTGESKPVFNLYIKVCE